jgi:hypothetical protein
MPSTIILLAAADDGSIDNCILYQAFQPGPVQVYMFKYIIEGCLNEATLNNIHRGDILATRDGIPVVVPAEHFWTIDEILFNTKPIFDELAVLKADEVITQLFRREDFDTFADVFLEHLIRVSKTLGLIWTERESPLGTEECVFPLRYFKLDSTSQEEDPASAETGSGSS